MRIATEPSADPADYEFTHSVRVRFAETDAMGIVHHSRYLPLLEEARVAYLRHIGHPYQSIRDEGIEMAVLEAALQYRSALRFDDVVNVHVKLAEVGRATFQMHYVLTRAGEVCATGVTAHGCITPDGKATRLPVWFRALPAGGRGASVAHATSAAMWTISSGAVTVTVAPEQGGRVAQITVRGVDLLVGPGEGRPDPSSPLAWGSYPMVPWAGRIRRGLFEFAGEQYRLDINHENHAIHGIGFDRPWQVTCHDATSIEMELDMSRDPRWPFGGCAHQRIEVADDAVSMRLTVTAGEHAMPVSIGWHPWFHKPDSVDFRPRAMYRRDDDYITVDELVDVPDAPFDDCFVNDQPVTIVRDGLTVRLESACTDWVVYDMPRHATCIEPQTAPPDAFNIGPHILDPGTSLSARYEITVARPD